MLFVVQNITAIVTFLKFSAFFLFLAQVQPQISWCQIDYEVIWRSGSGCPITKLSTVIESQKLSSDNTPDLMKVPPAPPLCLAAINIKSVTQKHSSHSEVCVIFRSRIQLVCRHVIDIEFRG